MPGDDAFVPLQAFVVYDDIFDAKNACDHLSGFNVQGRYLIVLYYQASKVRSACCLNDVIPLHPTTGVWQDRRQEGQGEH